MKIFNDTTRIDCDKQTAPESSASFASDEDVESVSEALIELNLEAYKELAK